MSQHPLRPAPFAIKSHAALAASERASDLGGSYVPACVPLIGFENFTHVAHRSLEGLARLCSWDGFPVWVPAA